MGTSRLPESCSPLTSHFQGALVAVDEWRCAGHDPARVPEEWSAHDSVALTRRGVWCLEVDGARHVVDAGAATLWRANESYRVRHPVAGGDHCTIIRVSTRGSAELAQLEPTPATHMRAGERLPWRRRSAPSSPQVYLLHRRVLSEARRSARTGDTMALEERALAVWHALLHDVMTPDGRTVRQHRALALAAREVIASRHREPLRVDDVARAVGCSPFHLSRIYRRELGETLHRTLTRLRVREALERVLDEPATLSRIALDAGFASHSHLTDALREEYGTSPTALRRAMEGST